MTDVKKDAKGLYVLTQENLKVLRHEMYPGGSGPLSLMRAVCRLIDSIAEEKGWDVGQQKHPLYPHKRGK